MDKGKVLFLSCIGLVLTGIGVSTYLDKKADREAVEVETAVPQVTAYSEAPLTNTTELPQVTYETQIEKSKYGDNTNYGQLVKGDYAQYDGFMQMLISEYGENLEQLGFPEYKKHKEEDNTNVLTVSSLNIDTLLNGADSNIYCTYIVKNCIFLGRLNEYVICTPEYGSKYIVIFKNTSGVVNEDLSEQGFKFTIALNSYNISSEEYGEYTIIKGIVDDTDD